MALFLTITLMPAITSVPMMMDSMSRSAIPISAINKNPWWPIVTPPSSVISRPTVPSTRIVRIIIWIVAVCYSSGPRCLDSCVPWISYIRRLIHIAYRGHYLPRCRRQGNALRQSKLSLAVRTCVNCTVVDSINRRRICSATMRTWNIVSITLFVRIELVGKTIITYCVCANRKHKKGKLYNKKFLHFSHASENDDEKCFF